MGYAGIGLLLICGSVYGFCRVYRVPATLPIVVVAALLLQLGVVHAAQVPGLAQVEDAKDGLAAWSDQQQVKAHEAAAQMRANRAALEGALSQ
jgi:hypothetical protein